MKVYVLVINGGEYSDAWQSNVGVFYNRDEAELHFLEIKDANKIVNDFYKKIPQFTGKFDKDTFAIEYKNFSNTKEFIEANQNFSEALEIFQEKYSMAFFQEDDDVDYFIEEHEVR